ncbi:MAG: imidazolonepropionase [Bryobacterales bacterium]|nr:imidazolonepropionase [Bryobacterales bacterium]
MVRQFQDVPAERTILVRGARQVLTLRGPAGPRRGAALSDLGIIADGAVLIRGGKILQASVSRRMENLEIARRAREINAAGRIIMPGFIDSRVQLLSPRPSPRGASPNNIDEDLWERLNELSASPARRLEARARSLLAGMARHGTTTIATVTNPVSDRARELKMLRVLAGLDGTPLTVFTAYCAQFVPPEYSDNDAAYIDSLCGEAMPVISRRKLVRFADVNCAAIELRAARKFLECARVFGLGLRCTAARAADIRLALELDVASVACTTVEQSEIAALRASNPVALLSPAPVLRGRGDSHPSARALIDGGAAVALASGFGLEQGATYNMQMAIALACAEMDMSPAEAVSAATINAAHALLCHDRTGTLEPGKNADLLMLNVEDYRDIPQQPGVNHVHMVLKNGETIYQEGEVGFWPEK